MEKYLVVLITAPNDQEASILSHALVEEKLIACANRFPVQSIYRWQDNIENEAEIMLICKIMASNLDKLIKRVKELHSYDVPEIIALPILGGSKDYLDWVSENTKGA
ncbi:MAG: divalent-cation tolerance protein CutA [Thermoplasmata archaeon]|nr:divalent-cation tolerance protein CutA [Thermoplasmata archaeon]